MEGDIKVIAILQVKGTYGKSGKQTSFVATGLSREGANRFMFSMKDKATGEEREISVAEYFVKHQGVRLDFPGLQCITVRQFSLREPYCSLLRFRLPSAALYTQSLCGAAMRWECVQLHVMPLVLMLADPYTAKLEEIRAARARLRLRVQGKGRNKQTMAVPMELMTIERGQKRRGLLIGDQQANLVRKAAQPPDTKRRDIAEWVGKASNSFKQVRIHVCSTRACVVGCETFAGACRRASSRILYDLARQ